MIERTKDYRIVSRWVSWGVVLSSKIYYLMEKGVDGVKGVWSYEPYQDGLRVHADLGVECRGADAIKSAKKSFEWIFSNTKFKNIYAGIPEENKPACRVAYMSGMDFEQLYSNIRWYKLNKW